MKKLKISRLTPDSRYLQTVALKSVETLGHSEAAYKAAKERLERKFGGQRRKIALHLEELEAIKSFRPGNARDLLIALVTLVM